MVKREWRAVAGPQFRDLDGGNAGLFASYRRRIGLPGLWISGIPKELKNPR